MSNDEFDSRICDLRYKELVTLLDKQERLFNMTAASHQREFSKGIEEIKKSDDAQWRRIEAMSIFQSRLTGAFVVVQIIIGIAVAIIVKKIAG